MKLQAIINSRGSLELALRMGRALPKGPGYRLADWIAGAIAMQRGAGIVQAVRANQWVVGGGALTPTQLDRLVRGTFRNTARCLYDFFHHLSDPDAIRRLVQVSPEFERVEARIREGNAGTLFVCPHLSNFDLAGHALGLRGMKIQVLSYPQPASGYREQNQIRSAAGLEMTPMSIQALRQAEERLRAGGVVLTGLDRPTSGSKYTPRFFGRPAALPVAHIRMALKVGVPIVAVAVRARCDGPYLLMASEPIPMVKNADLVQETVQNAEAVLRVIEAWIREAPDQWAMFYPVWPEALREIRGKP